MKAILWLTLLSCIACKPRVSGKSELAHQFGHTRRDPVADIRDCRNKSLRELRPGANEEIPEATEYLRHIAAQIMNANPNTFKDAYAPEQICLFVSRGADLNATASHEMRTVIFQAGILQVADNDAMVASIVAHELAHITMQHTHAREYDDLMMNQEWQKKGPLLEVQLKDLQKQKDTLWEARDQANRRLTTLNEEMDKKTSANIRNLREKLRKQENEIKAQILAGFEDASLTADKADALRRLDDAVSTPLTRQLPSAEDRAVLSETLPEKDILELQNKIKGHNKAVEELNAQERKNLPNDWQELDKVLTTLEKSPLEIEHAYGQIANKEEEIKSLKEKLVGNALYNWAEEEADDVGLELYLRAGWSPAFYSEFFRKQSLTKSEDMAACRSQLDTSMEPDRGIELHPADCWRIYNATIQEMKDHKVPYEEFMQKATRQHLDESRLPAIKKQLQTLLSN